MIAPRNLVLLLVLGLLIGAQLLLARGTTARVPAELFPDFLPAAARRIEVEVEGVELVLARRAEDAAWVLSGSADYPAREASVRSLLDRLASLSDLDLLTEDPARAGDYGLAEGVARVRVLGSDATLLAALDQGDPAPATRGAEAHYVRAEGSTRIVRAPRWRGLSARSVAWLDTTWVRFERALVRSLEVRVETQAGPRSRRVEREDIERWRDDAGQAVRAAPMGAVLDRLRSVFFDDVVGTADGAASMELATRPAAVVSLKLGSTQEDADTRTLELRVGAAADDGSRHAQVQGAQVVRLGPEMAAVLVETLGALIDVEGLR